MMDSEKELARLERAIKREGTTSVSPRRRAFENKDFTTSQQEAIVKASETFIQDDPDEVLEEDIIVTNVTPAPIRRNVEAIEQDIAQLRLEKEQAAAAAEEEERQRKKRHEEEERKKKEAEPKLEDVLEKTKRLREQEQLALQARLRQEKEELQREKDFAAQALEVARKAAAAPKAEPMRICARCDKETPMNNAKCAKCGFQGSLFGALAF